ncbi:hypothetical protein [Rhodococcus pyridinivorans]|uniref:Uncharacterized protein n=1 Tax=Rhodococcus pyridinivorans AK37 TaxID=1114960 RepID=H0JXH1_9NOCA|nr:hypothetical protein [Rhodococcus pyridinivorans]EHK80866.1 hypothetical protein AK37_22241 [Rhodococcus pyridinivorans AK37]MCD2142336.1 hypothetical protein [Rhodococcus pyridinivorans]
MSEWQKDLSAVAFEAAELVQRVRTVYLATRVVTESAPTAMAESVGQARAMLHAALDLIEAGAEHLLQMDDEQSVPQLADVTEIAAGPRFSQPGAVLNERGGECGMCGGPLIYDPELLCLKCRRQVASGTPAPADGWPL